MSIRINLLPHREMRRERRKKDFVGLIALVGIAALATAVVVAVGIDQQIDSQRARNDFIRAENAKLDEQIKEIATLRAEIDSLRARQYAVESLQTNRTPWLERPELIEIKAGRAGGPNAAKDARRVFEFSLNALIKTTDPTAQPQAPKTTAAPGTLAAARTPANR